jgi:ribosomal subunit interface protein
MKVPLKITFRDMPSSPAIETLIREKAAKLEEFCEDITRCHVTIEQPHRQHHKGNHFRVRVDITVPGEEVVVGRDPADNGAHEDAYVVIRDTFEAAGRQLREYAQRRRNFTA